MLFIHVSNHYEILRGKLFGELLEHPEPPFSSQEIIVPSVAVLRDLQLAGAKVLGVSAGQAFSFLGEWLWGHMARFVPGVQAVSSFSREYSVWRIYRLFQDDSLVHAHPRLLAYLGDRQTADPLMAYDLAYRVAGLFEAYITNRPDWLLAWQLGKMPASLDYPHARQDEAWQMALWQHFSNELGLSARHPSEDFFKAVEGLSQEGARAAGLPLRAHIFVPSVLPPLYLKILCRLSCHIDLYLYLLNPCQDYWLELAAKKYQARQEAAGVDVYLDDRYPLLADWGGQTQALFRMVLEEAEQSEEEGVFQPNILPGQKTVLLRRFQDSLLNLEAPKPSEWLLEESDRSVEVHVAHSLFRQLEILRDQLLERFEADATLSPKDVLIALPDLDAAAPLIEAVFGKEGADDKGFLPYAITGQKTPGDNAVARVLLQLMDLSAPPARMPVSQVFALLQEPLVASNFGWDEADLERLGLLFRQSGVHWGLSTRLEKSGAGLGDDRHSWKDALSRLMLGYAMPFDGKPFSGRIPAARLFMRDQEILGSLWEIFEYLETFSLHLSCPKPAEKWRALWQEALSFWLDETSFKEEEAKAMSFFIKAMDKLCHTIGCAAPELPIAFPVARAALEQSLVSHARGGIPSSAITFSPLASLRHLPYRLICLLEINDGVFPRHDRPLEFDLSLLKARPGDRQSRRDDRNLFLDLILSARDMLYISYTGRQQKDDAPLPPSVLVSELLDWLCRATGAPRTRFCIAHPLQAFSPRYFSNPPLPLKSFRGVYARALAASAQKPPSEPGKNAPLFFAAPLNPPEEREISLAKLQGFFAHPAQSLLKGRLGLNLPETGIVLEDEEPLLLDGLNRYLLAERLLPFALAKPAESPEFLQELEERALAGLELPGGQIGKALMAREVERLYRYVRQLKPRMEGLSTDPLEFCIPLPASGQAENPFQALTGTLSGWNLQGLLRYRCANARAADYISLWLSHLVFNSLCLARKIPGNPSCESFFIAQDKCFRFLPVKSPETLLVDWVLAWQQGQCQPLAFYPKTFWSLETAGKPEAYKKWLGSTRDSPEAPPPESQDHWWALALRGQFAHAKEALDTEFSAGFASWRQKLLPPLLQSLDAPELAANPEESAKPG